MKLYIQALELGLQANEIKNHVDPEVLKRIQGQGILQAYRVAHEGISKPKVLGEGNQILRWTRAVVRRLSERLRTGIKFFIDHGQDTNSHANRKEVGEVVASYTDEENGRLSNVVIGHFPDQSSVVDMDICSIEAEIKSDEDGVVGDIDEVSAVALGNSDVEHPAFAGALRLGAIQCFQIKSGEEEIDEMPENQKLTFEQVKSGIKDLNIRPRQVFTLEDLQDDRVFGKSFEELATLKAENERLTKAIETTSAESQASAKAAEKATAQTRLVEKLKEGFTEKQKSFITTRFLPEEMDDVSDGAIDSFVESAKKDFAETAKIFGVTEESFEVKKTTDEKPGVASGKEDLEAEALKEIGVL